LTFAHSALESFNAKIQIQVDKRKLSMNNSSNT